MRLAEVSQHFGWPRSSTFNILSTLIAREFLYEPESRGRFYPTPLWLALVQEFSAADPLPEELLNLLDDIRQRSGETVWIAAQSGQHAVFLEVIESKALVRYTAKVGTRVPLHVTATGQAIMSQLPPAQKASLLRKAVFKRYGEGSPMSVEAVEESIRISLDRGWFVSSSAFTPDLSGIALPIVFGGRALAITVAGPWFRVGKRLDGIAQLMHEGIALHLGPDYLAKNRQRTEEPQFRARHWNACRITFGSRLLGRIRRFPAIHCSEDQSPWQSTELTTSDRPRRNILAAILRHGLLAQP